MVAGVRATTAVAGVMGRWDGTMQGLRWGSATAKVAQQDSHNTHFSARALFAQPELAHDRAWRRWAPVVLGASSPMEGGCCAAVAAAAAVMARTTAEALGPVGPCRRPPPARFLGAGAAAAPSSLRSSPPQAALLARARLDKTLLSATWVRIAMPLLTPPALPSLCLPSSSLTMA